MTIQTVLQILWTSFATSSYYVLFAVAFALYLKVTKIWNFVQAGLMTVAFYMMYWGVNKLSLSIYIAFGMGVVASVLVGLGVEKYAFETLRRRESGLFTFFIFTLIFSEFIAYLFSLIFGTEPFTIFPNIMSPVMLVGGIIVSQWDLRAILISGLLIASLYALLRWSRPGVFLIAVSNSPRLSELYGISSRRSYGLAMILAAIFCAFGMYLLGLKIAVHPHLPGGIMILAVAASILGGIGNVFSAAIAALVLNLLQSLSVLIIPSRWQNEIVYVFFFMIIIFMPSGFGALLQARRKAKGK
jgi:branched-chain amino acid transport system permease protein